jgi:hypothetical protein
MCVELVGECLNLINLLDPRQNSKSHSFGNERPGTVDTSLQVMQTPVMPEHQDGHHPAILRPKRP